MFIIFQGDLFHCAIFILLSPEMLKNFAIYLFTSNCNNNTEYNDKEVCLAQLIQLPA